MRFDAHLTQRAVVALPDIAGIIKDRGQFILKNAFQMLADQSLTLFQRPDGYRLALGPLHAHIMQFSAHHRGIGRHRQRPTGFGDLGIDPFRQSITVGFDQRGIDIQLAHMAATRLERNSLDPDFLGGVFLTAPQAGDGFAPQREGHLGDHLARVGAGMPVQIGDLVDGLVVDELPAVFRRVVSHQVRRAMHRHLVFPQAEIGKQAHFGHGQRIHGGVGFGAAVHHRAAEGPIQLAGFLPPGVHLRQVIFARAGQQFGGRKAKVCGLRQAARKAGRAHIGRDAVDDGRTAVFTTRRTRKRTSQAFSGGNTFPGHFADKALKAHRLCFKELDVE